MSENPKKLYRSTTDRMIGGVCGGLGSYLNIDSTVIRLVFVLLTVFGIGSSILIYIIMLLIVPEEPVGNGSVVAAPVSAEEEVVEDTSENEDEA